MKLHHWAWRVKSWKTYGDRAEKGGNFYPLRWVDWKIQLGGGKTSGASRPESNPHGNNQWVPRCILFLHLEIFYDILTFWPASHISTTSSVSSPNLLPETGNEGENVPSHLSVTATSVDDFNASSFESKLCSVVAWCWIYKILVPCL